MGIVFISDDGRRKSEDGGQRPEIRDRRSEGRGQKYMYTSTQLHMIVYASLMAALTAAGSYLSIPIGPVPIVLQNLFIFLSGLLLGSRWGFVSVAVYILEVLAEFPFFLLVGEELGTSWGPPADTFSGIFRPCIL